MKDRIKQVINREGMMQSQFADFIEVNRPTLSHILAGRNNPSLEVVMKIHQKFPRINLSWLLDGIGPYETDTPTKYPNLSSTKEPMTDVNANSSYLQSEHSSVVLPDEQSKSHHYQGELFAENTIFASENTNDSKNRKEMTLQRASVPSYLSDSQIKYEKKSLQRKITEIKVFYDDGTYETFKQ